MHRLLSSFQSSLRHRLQTVTGALAIAITGSLASGQGASPQGTAKPPPPPFVLEDAFPGLSFNQPLGIVTAPGDKTRLFVLEKPGRISVITGLDGGKPEQKVFADFTHPKDGNFYGDGESGVLGLAFPADYATSKVCYVYYSLKIKIQKKLKLCERLSRFPISADLSTLDMTGEQPLFTQEDEASNHNGGDVQFGPDGFLYISAGDGGVGDDKLNNARFITKGFHAGILRIDPAKRPGSLPPNPHPGIALDAAGAAFYAIPADNPFIGASSYHGEPVDPKAVRTEFWATGLRNPWRMSFDEVTGRLFVGDVGQTLYEEINVITKGGDYGWSYREGRHPFALGPGGTREPNDFQPVEPIFEYPRTVGISVTGGVVSHDKAFAELEGAYVFADYGLGAIVALREKGSEWTSEKIAVEAGIAGIGKDPRDGAVLFANLALGKIKKLKRRP